MREGDRDRVDIKKMIADYMEAGFLENIIDAFRHDAGLFTLVSDLIQDERVRVRIGITALMEEMKKNGENISGAAPNLLTLLDHPSPVVRGDAANLLGIIGDRTLIPFLERAARDENPAVRLIAAEALDDLRKNRAE